MVEQLSNGNSSNEGFLDLPSNRNAILLPPEFEPGAWDVICQRGKDCQYHVGNRRFRICIENNLDSYISAKTRQEKSAVISSIVKSIEGNVNHAGGFIAKDVHSNRWYYVDNKVARDKVGNCLRDAIKQRTHSGGFVMDSFPDYSNHNESSSSKSIRLSPETTPSGNAMCTSSFHGNSAMHQNTVSPPSSPSQYKLSQHWVGRIEDNVAASKSFMGHPSAVITQFSNSPSMSPAASLPVWDSMDLEPRPLGSVTQHVAL